MNTLQDLRSTLDLHAADVTDTSAAERVASVAGRARAVRRRRAAGVAAGAVLAVGAVGALSVLPGERDLSPSDAPGSMSALGWRYQLADTLSEEGGRAELDLGRSDLPRLVSWSTDGSDQAVVVRLQGGETWSSDADDYGDFVWVPPGFEGRVVVSGPRGLDVSRYDLDQDYAPAGVGEGTTTYREDVAGVRLAGAGLGERGAASLTVPVDADRGTLQIAYACPGVPRGYEVRVGVVGEPGWFTSGTECRTYQFDPGGSLGIGMPGRWGPGSALRIWVVRDDQPVADGELPELELSLGAYALDSEPIRAAGNEFARTIECGGKVFESVEVIEAAGPGVGLAVPQDTDYAVDTWINVRSGTTYTTRVLGTGDDPATMGGLGGSGTGAVHVQPGADRVQLRYRGDESAVLGSAMVLYRRVE